jgi:hypothetical protein
MMRIPEKVRHLAEVIDPDAWTNFAINTTDRVKAIVMRQRREKSVDAALRALEAMFDITGSMAAEMNNEMIERWPAVITAAMEE